MKVARKKDFLHIAIDTLYLHNCVKYELFTNSYRYVNINLLPLFMCIGYKPQSVH